MSTMEVRYYVTDANRCPAMDFLSSLAEPFRGQIFADLTLLERDGEMAPISKKPIKGHKPLWELRIGGYRVFFVTKQDQDREIAACDQRFKKMGAG